MTNRLLLALLFALPGIACGAEPCLTASALTERIKAADLTDFDLHVQVGSVIQTDTRVYFIYAVDSTGPIYVTYVRNSNGHLPVRGDFVRIRGKSDYVNDLPVPVAVSSQIEILRHGEPICPTAVTLQDVRSGAYDWQLVRIKGLVRDICQSEIAAKWAILSIGHDGEIVRVHIPLIRTRFEDLEKLLGCAVTADGVPNPHNGSFRLFAGCDFHCAGLDGLSVTRPRATDPFAALVIAVQAAFPAEKWPAFGSRAFAARRPLTQSWSKKAVSPFSVLGAFASQTPSPRSFQFPRRMPPEIIAPSSPTKSMS